MDYKQYFKDKKVTLMGLGLLGRGLGDAIFLAEHGAELIVTDLRGEKTLVPSLAKLRKYKNIRYTLGQHKLEDFRNRDFILKAAGVPLDSPYIAEAQKHGVPIEMDASLFAKLMPKGVTLVGVTGTRGKSTVTALIYEILKERLKIYDLGFKNGKKPKIYKGGNLVPEATLPLLEKVKSGDIVVLELDSWQLQGFHDAKISPQVAVFTTFLDDHLIYYKGDTAWYFEDKAAIFKYQKTDDTLIVGERVANLVSSRFELNREKGRTLIARARDIPKDWKIKIPGEHNRENISCAVAAARALGISDLVIKKVVEGFKGVSGRLEYLRTVRLPAQAGGVKIYNDNNATTPDATIAALRTLSTKPEIRTPKQIPKSKILNHKSIILIMGGTDKGLDISNLVAEIPKYCKAVVFLKETGTDKLLSQFPHLNSSFLKGGARRAEDFVISQKETLKECVEEGMKLAKKGDTILFSPAFASFGRWFRNEYDRGNQFLRLVKELK